MVKRGFLLAVASVQEEAVEVSVQLVLQQEVVVDQLLSLASSSEEAAVPPGVRAPSDSVTADTEVPEVSVSMVGKKLHQE